MAEWYMYDIFLVYVFLLKCVSLLVLVEVLEIPGTFNMHEEAVGGGPS